jgi:hypothetical protein
VVVEQDRGVVARAEPPVAQQPGQAPAALLELAEGDRVARLGDDRSRGGGVDLLVDRCHENDTILNRK